LLALGGTGFAAWQQWRGASVERKLFNLEKTGLLKEIDELEFSRKDLLNEIEDIREQRSHESHLLAETMGSLELARSELRSLDPRVTDVKRELEAAHAQLAQVRSSEALQARVAKLEAMLGGAWASDMVVEAVRVYMDFPSEEELAAVKTAKVPLRTERYTAVIRGEELEVGEKVDDATIVTIAPSQVEFEKDDIRFVVTVGAAPVMPVRD
jgi:hypothetical protein